MVASLDGIIFDQVYGDNSGGAEFDTDGDGTASQEDEFVSFTNTTGEKIDISGWEVWSDSTGTGAPGGVTDGLYHTFPPDTVLVPGQTIYVINEVSGEEPGWAQESSEGGLEQSESKESTNLLTEGSSNDTDSESVVLVNPDTGEYIVFNMSEQPSTVPDQSGFPGKTNVGEVPAFKVQEDQNAGSSYQYNEDTGQYEYTKVFVPCFARGTLIRTPGGDVLVERLRTGDMVCTLDHGAQPIKAILMRNLDFSDPANDKDRPILICAGALAPGQPSADLTVSPQHRMLVILPCGTEALAPAKGLTHLPGVRIKRGMKRVQYIHLVFARHEVVFGNNAPSESFFGGQYLQQALPEFLRSKRDDPSRPHARRVLQVRHVAQHI